MALIFVNQAARDAWNQAAEWAKENGKYEKRTLPDRGQSHVMTFMEAFEYLDNYGDPQKKSPREDNRMQVKIRAGAKFDLGEHGFYLDFESRDREGNWHHFMNGGLVLATQRDGRDPADVGWSVHT